MSTKKIFVTEVIFLSQKLRDKRKVVFMGI